MSLPNTLTWENGQLSIIDQTKLPEELIIERQENLEQVWHSIKMLKVRGAPAIGIAGGYGFLIGMQDKAELSLSDFKVEAEKVAKYLDSSRPTAVNLSWALNRMLKLTLAHEGSVAELLTLLETEAIAIHDEDRAICRGIGEHGVKLFKEGIGVLTHCNAGSLAVSERGTALSPIYQAHEQGLKPRVYADETRPLLQGSRLTAWELQQAGVDVTVIADNMAAHIMSQGLVDIVIVGTDRVAANGDVANKIGTFGVAILAKHFGIPVYVACPSSTVDLKTATGADIVIEERGSEEICHFGQRRTAPVDIKVRNPAFDVTPHEMVAGLITEKGILEYPYDQKLKELFS